MTDFKALLAAMLKITTAASANDQQLPEGVTESIFDLGRKVDADPNAYKSDEELVAQAKASLESPAHPSLAASIADAKRALGDGPATTRVIAAPEPQPE